MQPSSTHWFRNTVLYQIYPRSFSDANGDGVGDLRGITSRLRYLNGEDDSLGVGAIWLSPFYPSPMKDFGYDVTDHCGIDPLFGTLHDFSGLLDEAHRRSIKVFIDLIPNHTSDQHPWFKESKSSITDKRRDWYVWRDPRADGGPPNNWLSVFGGSAWEYDETTNQYYLHSFLKEQPDLNWENPGVRAAIKHIMKFWLDFGVDGFRVDAITYISKDPRMQDDPVNTKFEQDLNPYKQFLHTNSNEGPKLFQYIESLTDILHSYDDRFMIFESTVTGLSKKSTYLGLYDHVDPLVAAPFNFDGIHSPWKASTFKTFVDKFQAGMHPSYVPVYVMGNHDQPRLVSRIGLKQARAAAVMQFSLPGLPVIYYGDELGMENGSIEPVDVQDPFEKQVPGKGLGRDPERTPMQWSALTNSGFSTVKPWLPVHTDYLRINVDSERMDPQSFFNLYRSLIVLRKQSEVLRHGSYQSLELEENVFGFIRRYETTYMICVINFSDNQTEVSHDLFEGEVALSSYSDSHTNITNNRLTLRPHEAVILRP